MGEDAEAGVRRESGNLGHGGVTVIGQARAAWLRRVVCALGVFSAAGDADPGAGC